MAKISTIQAVHKIGRLVFTTREIAGITGASVTSATQCLRRLEMQGVIQKITQGLWGLIYDKRFSPFVVIPCLAPNHRSYLSFISALHYYGIISQIPQVTTVASTAHSKVVNTSIGVYHVHQISPDFFAGFDWNKTGDYLIASPEKALVDCLYITSRKGRSFAHFPELNLDDVSRQKALEWANKIMDPNIRTSVIAKIKKIL